MVKINNIEYIGIMEYGGKFFCDINICNAFYPDFTPYFIFDYNNVELIYNGN